MTSIETFHLPRYDEIPNVGFYLEQATEYMNSYLEPLQDVTITSSMISNYVKKGLIANTIKKQYFREHIVYLFCISIAKNVLSLENIKLLIETQKNTFDIKSTYNYFCDEFENILFYIYGLKKSVDELEAPNHEAAVMFRNVIITASHKIYLDSYFHTLQENVKN